MTHGVAVLLALALSGTPAAEAHPAPPGSGGRAAPARSPPGAPPPVACARYRVLAEKNDLVPDDELARWVSGALEKATLLDPASPCFVHVRVTAGPLRTGGKEDGFVAHVAASTRRFARDGKLVTHEKGMLFVEPHREAILPRVRTFLEEFVAGLGAAPASSPSGGARGSLGG